MRPADEHLTVEEIVQILFRRAHPEDGSVERELEEHLDHCEHCFRVKQEHWQFMSKLYQFGKAGDSNPTGPCPPPAMWAEVVTGLMPQNAALRHLEHAATCSVCAEELQNALYAVGDNAPVPEALQVQLQTALQEWQRKFAAKIALNELVTATERPRKVVSSGAKVRPFFLGRWSVGTAAALIVLAVGLGLFFRGRHNSPDALIRQAYAQQRTMEMMIPGAGYGPIQVERANGQSSINRPRPLLEAEVLIKSGLEKAPNDPELLRQKAEADLLTGNYQPAIDTLNHAVHLKPGSVPLLVDLGTAYFERAEANSSPADYETGLETLGDAIRLEPSNPAALFNRAILYERLYFYDRAVADLEQFLKLEQDRRWKQEAEQRLQEIHSRQSQHGLNVAPDTLPPGRFQQEVAGGGVVIEEYVEAAERVVLPNIRAPVSQDEHYQAALTLAQNLRSQHSDPFLADLLLSAGQNDFSQAALALSQSSFANHGGHFEKAHSEALRAAALFRKSGNSAGWLAALFEQSYALQFESQAGACQSLAGRAADDAHRLGYVFLEIQLRLEYAICSNMKEHLGQAKQIVQCALVMAKDHGYQSLYLRALNLLAGLESDAGDDARAWSAVQEGLALYWKAGLPQVRAYSLYAVLDLMAGRLGHANVQFAALSEALKFRANNMNRVVEAAAHARLGNAALRLGDLAVAEAQFAEARSIFASEPQTDSVRWRELEARINLARVQAMHGQDTSRAAALLTNALPEVEGLSNRYLEFLYYDTLAELKMRAGDAAVASQSLERAINIAETGARSLSTWQERVAWMEMHRQPFVAMTMLLLDSGSPEQALALWQRFRTAGTPQTALSGEQSGKNRPARNLLRPVSASPVLQLRSYVLTYAFLPSGLIIWVHHGEEVHAVRVPVTDRGLQRTAEDFISECSRSGSDLADLQANGRILYQWLVQPVRQWLPLSGHLIVEPDSILSALPLEALIDENSEYLGERYAISIALNGRVNAGNDALEKSSFADNQRALIVTAVAPTPPPGAMAEAMHVAARFSHPDLLFGSDASVSRVARELVRSTIFHFAGHAGSSRDGATLLLADGVLRRAASAQRLDHLQLAVFSACDTARPSETSSSRSLVSDFLQAGARNVVASRWNVDSLATEDFMDLFYGSLLSGHAPAEALRAAANSLRQMPGRAHPYYWAAFAAFGGA